MPVTPFSYRPLYKPQQLLSGQGQTAVVTGWTVKQALFKRLLPHEYAVIGNLYSPTRGLSPLIRNLLANPHVRFLVVLNATKEDANAGGCECLLDFFRHGFAQGTSDTGRNCWLVRSAIPGYIDPEIPASALQQLRQALQWQEAKSIAEAVQWVKAVAETEVEAWGDALLFPHTETTPTVLPGPRYGHRIQGKTIAQTWVKIIHRIKTTGTIRPTQYGQWQELIDLVAIVTNEPPDFYFPDPNYLPIAPEFVQTYASQMLDDAFCLEGVKYTYGQRLRSWFGKDQIEQAINKLVAEIDSSRVVMSLWDVQDYEGNESPPCLNHIWLRVVDGELSLTATFRSNDMFAAWPANAMGLRTLQQYICQEINWRQEVLEGRSLVRLGPLITISQSAHIYSDCWEHAEQVIRAQYQHAAERDYSDPSGSFTITVQEQIVVEHLSPGAGEVVNRYEGKSARKLYHQIAADCPSLEVEHALYLGTELQKAEIALSHQREYEQDRPLR
ncbi:MAG: thymidylate synthase [Cyanophyceae cyanobacterium]